MPSGDDEDRHRNGSAKPGPTDRERLDRESLDGESLDRESADRESADRERADREPANRERADREPANRESTDREPRPAPAEQQWHADGAVTVAKLLGVGLFAAVPPALSLNAAARWFGAAVAAALVVYALRDVIAPIRLSANRVGVRVISGFAGHRDIAWDDIERMRIIRQRGSTFLEIETAESVHLFSRYDLSAHPTDVLDILQMMAP